MTDTQILQKLKEEIIDEKTLVSLFATPTVKNNHKKNGCFRNNEKHRVLERARKFCEISDNKDRTFTITKVYKNMLPTNFSKMNSDLYKYICPLILSSLMCDSSNQKHNIHNKVTLTIGLWAREIKMVNHNYDFVKDNCNVVEKKYELLDGVVGDFCSRCDKAIDYYVVQALKYLKSAGLILWRDVYFVQPVTPTIKKDDITYIAEKTPPRRQATQQDMEFYARCVETADKYAGINNAQERYYSYKSYMFRTCLHEELAKGGIQYVFKSYEAYYVHANRCREVLQEFDYNDKTWVQQFNDAFADKILTNAHERNLQKQFAKSKDDYLVGYANLCEMVIDSGTEEDVKEMCNR